MYFEELLGEFAALALALAFSNSITLPVDRDV